MIIGYQVVNGNLLRLDNFPLSELGNLAWLDIVSPSAEELDILENKLHVHLAHHSPHKKKFHELEIIEITERELCHTVPVSFFMLHSIHLLVTIHNGKTDLISKHLPEMTGKGALDILLLILWESITKIDGNIHMVEENFREISSSVFTSDQHDDQTDIICSLGHNSDLLLTIQQNLKKFGHMVNLFENEWEDWLETSEKPENLKFSDLTSKTRKFRKQFKKMKAMISHLSTHSSLIQDKCNLILSALLGRIQIEQNRVIKLFSVVSVVFLPPTLIASVYGMNFEHMPELSSVAGYPISLMLMLVSAIIPILIFRQRGWI